MAIISLPTSFRPVGFSFGQQRFDTMERSDSTGAESARLLAPPRWTCGIQSSDHMTLSEAGQWEAWFLKLRGGVNVAAIYDPVRTRPEGTLRGAPVLGLAAAAGATTVTLGACTGTNVLRFVSNYNNAYWTRTRSSITSNAATAPDGTTTADTLVEDTSASTSHYLQATTTLIVPSVRQAFAIRFKSSGRPAVRLEIYDAAATANFVRGNFEAGDTSPTSSVGGNGVLSSVSISGPDAVGYYTASVAGTPNTSGTSTLVRVTMLTAKAASANYTGDGTSGVTLWGAQLEEGASASTFAYPTLKAGDALQISTGVGTSQLVKGVADATATAFAEAVWQTGGGAQAIWSGSGGQATWSDDGSPGESMAVTFEPPLRIAYAKDTAVTWDRPVAYYRMHGYPKWQYSQRAYRREGGFAADFLETFN